MQTDPEPDREIVSTRVFDAPHEVVVRAFGDPRMLARWWGPKGFTNTFHELDLRPGGAWRFVMHGPDGTDYHNATDFILERVKGFIPAANEQNFDRLEEQLADNPAADRVIV